jgi:aspartokinase
VGDVPIRMVSQAASRRNITFVIRESDVATALSRMHESFFAPYPVSASVAGTRG